MTQHPIAIALALIFATTAPLSGCDRASNLTEQEHIQRAKDFEDNGDLKGGVIELKNAIQKNPDSAQARLLLGQIYLKLGHGDEAEKELSRAEKLGVNPESIKLQLGKAWLLMGEYNRVLEEISPAGSTSPKNKATILQMQGDAMLGLHKLEEGCALYKDSLVADPKHLPSYWGLANCAVAKGTPAVARAHVQTALRIDQSNDDSWVLLGDIERTAKNPTNAETAYSNALKHDPRNTRALLNRALTRVGTGKIQAAQMDLLSLQKLAPDDYATNYLQGMLHYVTKKKDSAMDSVLKSLKKRPDYAPAVLLKGLLEYDKAAYEQAAKTLSRYIEAYPAHIEARKLLAATEIKLRQPDRALDILKPLLITKTDDAQLLALTAEAFALSRQPDAATEFYEKASDLVPMDASLRTELALSRLAAGDQARAIADLEAAAKLDSSQHTPDIALISYFLSTQQDDKALEKVIGLVKKLPESPLRSNLEGVIYSKKKDFASARRSFEHALTLSPSYLPAAINLAQLDLRENNPRSAKERFEGILTKDSSNVSAMLALAWLAKQEGNSKNYIAWLEKAAKTDPKAIEPRSRLISHYLAQGNSEKAMAVAREGYSTTTGSYPALRLLANTELATGQERNALSSFTKLVQMDPNAPSAYYGRARAHAGLGNIKATRDDLRKALTIKPDYLEALVALSSLETRSGNIDDAIKIARELQKLDSSSPTGFMLEGDAHSVNKNYKKAISLYEQASIKREDGEIFVKLHHALMLEGDIKQADSKLLDWLKVHPKDNRTRLYLAQSYAERDHVKPSIFHYEILIREMPNNFIFLNNLATQYQKSGDARALSVAQAAYRLEPSNPVVMDTLGWILIESGQLKQGIQLLKKAATVAPGIMTIRYHYAVALAKIGDRAKARKELSSILASGNNFPEMLAAKTLYEQLNSAGKGNSPAKL